MRLCNILMIPPLSFLKGPLHSLLASIDPPFRYPLKPRKHPKNPDKFAPPPPPHFSGKAINNAQSLSRADPTPHQYLRFPNEGQTSIKGTV